MELRRLGNSDLEVPLLALGTGTFGGSGPIFAAWGQTDVVEARRFIDICLEAGCNFYDTADAYSGGAAEQILGEALGNRRQKALIATKVGLPTGAEPAGYGLGEKRLTQAVEASLRRLRTDYIDLLQLHALDASVPPEDLLRTLRSLVDSGKVRHVGASNYPAWQLMKALSLADQGKGPRFVSHQVYYSLIGRDHETDLMPLGLDQNVGTLVWSPLGWGRLVRRLQHGELPPKDSRQSHDQSIAPHVEQALLERVLACLEGIAEEVGRSIPQVALNWLRMRPGISSVIIGARTESQLRDNLAAAEWSLTAEQIEMLDLASAVRKPYPQSLYAQGPFAMMNPPVI
ncbi:aldo/keto reductase [Novosphingobium sp. MW5]|nr:aldo/keto reductase [Novosphingobium sp. MW5]